MLEGAIYSVDDVSDLLGIPRPTLYRYLREYSIPHLRQAGRIRIPEDSFDSIREARDLHKEGLGTESVRRQLREGGGPDTDELDQRLNSLHDTLEDLRSDLRSKPATTGEVALSPALRTILARQSLMLNAMFNLTGMVESLLLSNSRPRRRPPQAFEDDLAAPLTIPAEDRAHIPGAVITKPVPMQRTEAPPAIPLPGQPEARKGFGSLGRRRRRGAVALLSAVLLTLGLALFLPALGEDRTTAADRPAARNDDPQKTPDEKPAAAAGDQEDAPANDANGGDADNKDTGDVAATEARPPEAAATKTGEDAGGAASDSESGVPDVSGRPLDEAAREISEAGYAIAAIRSEPGSEDPGTVTGTEPSAGTEAPSDAAIVLITSAGPAGAPSASASSSAGASAAPSSAAGASASASPAP